MIDLAFPGGAAAREDGFSCKRIPECSQGAASLRARSMEPKSPVPKNPQKEEMLMKKVLGIGLLLVGVVSLAAFRNDDHNSLVRFNGGIGVDPVSNVVVNGTTTTVSANVVRG